MQEIGEHILELSEEEMKRIVFERDYKFKRVVRAMVYFGKWTKQYHAVFQRLSDNTFWETFYLLGGSEHNKRFEKFEDKLYQVKLQKFKDTVYQIRLEPVVMYKWTRLHKEEE